MSQYQCVLGDLEAALFEMTVSSYQPIFLLLHLEPIHRTTNVLTAELILNVEHAHMFATMRTRICIVTVRCGLVETKTLGRHLAISVASL